MFSTVDAFWIKLDCCEKYPKAKAPVPKTPSSNFELYWLGVVLVVDNCLVSLAVD